jgi:hypothetical protein
MTETLVREREWQLEDSGWEVVGDTERSLDAEPSAPSAAQDWVSVSDEASTSSGLALNPQQRAIVVSVLDVLLDDWKQLAAHQSSIFRATKHPIYRLILQAKDDAVPELLKRLEQEASPLWIWALGDVTGQDPAVGTTTVDDAAQAWLSWGRTQTA